MRDEEVMVEESTEKVEWYRTWFTCLSCGDDFMCNVHPNFCPNCGKKIIGIKCGLITSYYSFEKEVKD